MTRPMPLESLYGLSLDVERSLVGSCILDPARLDELDQVEPQHFGSDACRMTWQALQQLRSNGVGIDTTTLAEELGRHGWLPTANRGAGDTAQFLIELMESVAVSAHAAYYAREVLKHAKRRSAVSAATEITAAAADLTQDVDDVLLSVEQRLHEAMSIGSQNATASLSDLFLEALSSISKGEPRGIATNWPALDEQFLGWCPGHLVILAARPSMGKTALALQVAQRVAETGRSVLYITLEMSAVEIAERLLARNAAVSEYLMRKGATTSEQNIEILHQSAVLSHLKLAIDDRAEKLSQVLYAIRLARRRHGVSVVVIDYLQLIDNKSYSNNREQQIADISRSLKKEAKRNQVCVIALSQLNRSVETRDDKTPRLSDLRESGAIEQDADCVLLLHRPSVFDPEHDPYDAQVIIAKQRAGPTGKVRLDFEKQFGSFSQPQSMADRVNDAFD